MTQKDFYKTLGVSENATQQEIKKAFRELAKKHHPDRHKGDKDREARFKEISEAYETLSDEEKRAEYDNLRRYGAFAGTPGGGSGASFQDIFGSQFGGGGATFSGSGAEFGDLFSSIFEGAGGSARRGRHEGRFHFGGPFGSGFESTGPRRGADASAELTINFEDAINGAEKQITIDSGSGSKTVKVKIPKGVADGKKIRLKGLGGPGVDGGPSGDLLVTVRVRKHQKFRREGLDIITPVTIPLKVAALGGKVRVDTLTRPVMLTVPAGTQPGARLRLKGQGISLNGKTGDLIVEVAVNIPRKLTAEQKRLFESLPD